MGHKVLPEDTILVDFEGWQVKVLVLLPLMVYHSKFMVVQLKRRAKN
jgi:hypothetical protein